MTTTTHVILTRPNQCCQIPFKSNRMIKKTQYACNLYVCTISTFFCILKRFYSQYKFLFNSYYFIFVVVSSIYTFVAIVDRYCLCWFSILNVMRQITRFTYHHTLHTNIYIAFVFYSLFSTMQSPKLLFIKFHLLFFLCRSIYRCLCFYDFLFASSCLCVNVKAQTIHTISFIQNSNDDLSDASNWYSWNNDLFYFCFSIEWHSLDFNTSFKCNLITMEIGGNERDRIKIRFSYRSNESSLINNFEPIRFVCFFFAKTLCYIFIERVIIIVFLLLLLLFIWVTCEKKKNYFIIVLYAISKEANLLQIPRPGQANWSKLLTPEWYLNTISSLHKNHKIFQPFSGLEFISLYSLLIIFFLYAYLFIFHFLFAFAFHIPCFHSIFAPWCFFFCFPCLPFCFMAFYLSFISIHFG